MKFKICKIVFLCGFLVLIPGCKSENFFDIPSAMNPPRISENQNKIKSVVHEYLESDIIWVYPLFEGKYSSVISFEDLKNGKNLKIVFCKSTDVSDVIHILVISCLEENYELINDILIDASDIEKVWVIDINGDNKKELVILARNFTTSQDSIYAYECNMDSVDEIDMSADMIEKLKKQNMEDFK